MAINEGIESLRELFRGRPGASRRCDEGIWTGVRLVFGEFAASEPLKSQRTILRIHGNLPSLHRYGSDDRVEIVSICFAERFDRHHNGIETQAFNLSIDQGLLTYFKSLTTEGYFIRRCYWNKPIWKPFDIASENISMECAGIEKCFRWLAFNFNCLNYAAHQSDCNRIADFREA